VPKPVAIYGDMMPHRVPVSGDRFQICPLAKAGAEGVTYLSLFLLQSRKMFYIAAVPSGVLSFLIKSFRIFGMDCFPGTIFAISFQRGDMCMLNTPC
jgi:hypothetical protein